MFCSKCGAQVNDNAEVCMNCGCKVSKSRKKSDKKGMSTPARIICLVLGIFIGIVTLAFACAPML